MGKLYSGMTAIVVGSKRHYLVMEATAALHRAGISFEACQHVYSAAAMMAAAEPGTNLLVIGCLITLTADDMRLISLAPKDKKVFFCCILKRCFEPLQDRLLAAVKAGVFVVNRAEQMDDIIRQCKNAAEIVRQKNDGRGFAARIASLADSFFLTQAEQDALLGVETNADAKNLTLAQ